MAKKIFMAAVVGLIICAGVKAEAADIYVGMSPATGFECCVMTNTIRCTQDTPIERAMCTVIKDY